MKKNITFGAGVLVGAVLFGGSVVFAAGILANPTQSRVFVDGNEVKLTAYNINDNNYFKLRDIGNEVDFSVVWDGDGQRILIDTSRGYDPNETYKPQTTETPTPTTPSAAKSVAERIETIKYSDGTGYGIITTGDAIPGKLANGKDITTANLAAMFAELEALYPDGISWGDGENGTLYTHMSALTTGGGCNSWAGMVADLLWGKGATYTTHGDLTRVKAGDVVHLKDNASGREHWFVVRGTGTFSTGDAKMLTCDGNANGKVGWAERATAYTAKSYPDTIVYSAY